jgi:hypothetical protein
VLCEKCGSVDVVRTPSSYADRLVRLMTGKKRFTCMRCGWTARRDWHPVRKRTAAPKDGPVLVKPEPRDDGDLSRID